MKMQSEVEENCTREQKRNMVYVQITPDLFGGMK